MRRALLLSLLMIGGCATVSVEVDHVSHVTQHFGSHPTDYGYDSANLVARWSREHLYAELSEGIVLESRDGRSYGGLWGPREVFSAKVGYVLWSP